MVRNRKKIKVLLVQVSINSFNNKANYALFRVPLASAYLKAFAEASKISKLTDIEILDPIDADLSCDSMLIDIIVSKAPDVLGLTLYSWNSMRSLYIAEEVKKRLPFTRIIVGGNDVASDSEHILNNNAVDIGCIGEGEQTFVDLLEKIINKQSDYGDIKGIFYKRNSKAIFSQAREPEKNLSLIPSPYISGAINPRDYRLYLIECTRGCRLKCSYCASGGIPWRRFPVEKVFKELEIAAKSAKLVFFIDTSFLDVPDFYKICEKIKDLNKDDKLSFICFANAESIDSRKADMLKECNFVHVDIGLQSSNSFSLNKVDRRFNAERFLQGVALLDQRNIDYQIDIIAGLPNETFESYVKTVNFLKNNKIINKVITTTLQVLPGTKLRKEAAKYGMKYLKEPPYWLIEADYISKNKINTEIELASSHSSNKDIKDSQSISLGKKRPVFYGSLVNSCSYKNSQKSAHKNTNSWDIVNKVILKLDKLTQTKESLDILAKQMSRKIQWPFTLWIITDSVADNINLLSAFITPITETNPFLCWNVVIETDKILLSEIESLQKLFSDKIRHRDIMINTGASFCIILPYDPGKLKEYSCLAKIIPCCILLKPDKNNNWRRIIESAFSVQNIFGILFDFDIKNNINFVVNVLKYLKSSNKHRNKGTFFKDIALIYTGVAKDTQDNKLPLMFWEQNYIVESVIGIDKNLAIKSILKPDKKTIKNLLFWQFELMKKYNILQADNIIKPVVLTAGIK